MSQIHYQSYEEKCKKLLQENKIRYASIIDHDGKLLAGGFKGTIEPLEGDETKLHHFVKFIAQISLQKKYDQALGQVNYLAVRRDKIVLISFPFPITKVILLLSAEPSVDIERIAKRVVQIFNNEEMKLFVEE